MASLPSDLFDGLPALEILQLGGNQLDNLQSDVFDGLPALWFLDLSNNRLTRLSAGAFNGLPALEKLVLGANPLSTLPVDVFDGLSALWFLDLEDLQLSALPAEVFDGLTALEELNLEANRLSALPAGVFDGLSSLTQLTLMANQLTSLPEDLFGGLSALTTLRLDQNRLSSLPADLFEGLSSLQELWLHTNRLTSAGLPSDVFDGLSSLFRLVLRTNRLTTLPDGLFDGLSALTIIELYGNSVDPMVVAVSLEKVGNHGFKATAPAGAPFTMTLPVSVTNGSIDGGAATLTIPAGAVESAPLTVTRTAGTAAGVTADIGPSLPALPPLHLGYALAKAPGLPLQVSAPRHRQPLAAPQIVGLPQVGNALEVSFAEPPAGALAYQWLRGSEVIDGAAARTYVPTAGDVGSRLSVRVDRGGVSITSPATAPVWPAPANPPLADGEEELLSATVTLGSHQFPFWVAGYGRIRGESFGEMDVTSFEDGGAMYVIDAFFVNSRGVFGLAAGSTLPDASGLVAYWNGYRIPELEAHTGNGGKSPPILMGPTPQPKTEYSRYEGGASDGIRVAVSLRRAGTPDEPPVVSAGDASANEGDAAAPDTIIKDDELTARFEDLPAEHDGESAFTFRVAFSDGIKISYKTVRDVSFQVTAGDVTGARRVDRRRDLWEITVEPDSDEAVRIHLPETSDCGESGAICASDGRPLSHALSATVAGPAGLSVADAEADEAAGATMRFAVTLDRTAARTVTVDWTTADGTARAGADYAAAEGTLTFAPGERSKTVAVTVFDDSVDDGGETFGLLLSNPSGARLADAEGIGTIHNADPLPQAWLVRFSRTAADQAIDAIGERFENPGGDSHATFAGRRLWNGGGPPVSAGAGAGGSRRPFGTKGQYGRIDTPGTGMTAGFPPASGLRGMANGGMHATGGYRPTLRDLLIGSSFRLSAGHAGGDGESRRLTAWGRASAAGFDGASGGVSVNGEVATFLLGADAAWNRWLAGVSVAHSLGAGAFRGAAAGDLDSTLTAVHPYVRYRVTRRLTAWGVLGYGAGDLTLETAGSAWRTDTSMRMAAAGARGVFLGGGGLELAAKMDARVTHIGSGAAVGETGLLGAASGGTSRLRLLLEGSRSFGFGETRTLTPTLELGVRRDGGDAETGAGVDIGGSLRYVDAALGLTIDAGGRYLAAHEDDAYREWGASASIRIDPGTPGRGLTLAIAPSWGAAAAGGAERLWSLTDARGLADGGYAADPSLRLDANVGYGLGAFRGRGGMLPFAGLRLAGLSRDWRAGVKWKLGENAAFGFEATRRDSPMAPPGHGIAFQAALRW